MAKEEAALLQNNLAKRRASDPAAITMDVNK